MCLGLLAMVVALVLAGGRPATVQACAPGIAGSPLAPVEFLGRVTSVEKAPSNSTAVFAAEVENSVNFDVVRVIQGSVGASVTLLTPQNLKVGQLYTVPVFGDHAGTDCGLQPEAGNLSRLIGYAPTPSHPVLLWLGGISAGAGLLIALLTVWKWRRPSASVA
jgi:hypothetical protein